MLGTLLLFVSLLSLQGAEYRYFYKDGKKYRVKVTPSSNASTPKYKYKYIYKDGKKYRVKIRVKPQTKSTAKAKPQYKYRYFYKDGKKYRVKVKVTPEKAKSETVNSSEKKATAQKQTQKEPSDASWLQKFVGKDKNIYFGVDVVSRSVNNDYTIGTNSVTGDNNESLQLTHPAAPGNFPADGSTQSFSETVSVTGFNLKMGLEDQDRDKLDMNLFYDSEEVNIGLGYRYVMPSLSFLSIHPYLQGRIVFVYNELGDLTGFVPNTYGLSYGFGGEYDYSNNIFLNAGLNMSQKTWAEESNAYSKEEKKSSSTSIYFGGNYRF